MVRDRVEFGLTILLVAVAVVLVVGQLAGQPILLGYVTSDSMSPALSAGDGFVAIPQQIAGDPEPGDVVVFHARELDGGGLTTHRVVADTEAGYVTRGDANPFTDQDGAEPPVADEQIVATALQVDGSVVTVPGLGTAVLTVRGGVLALQDRVAAGLGVGTPLDAAGVGTTLFALGLGLFVLSLLRDHRQGRWRKRDRSRHRDPTQSEVTTRNVLVVLAVIVLLPANLAMVAPSGSGTVVVDGGAAADAGIEPGTTIEHELPASNDGFVAVLIVVDAPDMGATVEPDRLELPSGASTTATLSVDAPEPDDQRSVSVTQHRYLLVLPASTLATLHGIHPAVAWGAINLVLAGGLLGLVGGLLGLGRTRLRDRGRPSSLSLVIRIRRRLR